MSLFKIVKEKIFYGWWIVAISLVIGSALFGIQYSFGVFFKTLQKEFELTRTETSSLFFAYMILCGVFVILIGWILDKYGPRLVVFLMGFLSGLSLLLTSQANSSWQLFLSYSLLLSMGTAGTMPVLMSIISRWFNSKRGLALGIGGAGSGLGTMAMAPFATYLISNLGWRMSYIVIGLVTWLVVIPLSMLLKNDPSQIGTLPDGVKLEAATAKVRNREGSSQLSGLSLLQSSRTGSFWLILAIWLSLGLCLSLVFVHLVPYATDTGIAATRAAIALSLMGCFNILSRLLTGKISDIVGRKMPIIICLLLQAGALVWLIWSHQPWMFYLFAVVYGLSWGGLGVVPYAMAADIFGERNLGLILGMINVGFAIGSAIGPLLGGFIFDVTGSYNVAFAIAAAAMFVTALLAALTRLDENIGTN